MYYIFQFEADLQILHDSHMFDSLIITGHALYGLFFNFQLSLQLVFIQLQCIIVHKITLSYYEDSVDKRGSTTPIQPLYKDKL